MPLCTADSNGSKERHSALFNQAFYLPWPPIGPGPDTLGFDQALVSSFCYKNNSETSFRDIEYMLALRHFENKQNF